MNCKSHYIQIWLHDTRFFHLFHALTSCKNDKKFNIIRISLINYIIFCQVMVLLCLILNWQAISSLLIDLREVALHFLRRKLWFSCKLFFKTVLIMRVYQLSFQNQSWFPSINFPIIHVKFSNVLRTIVKTKKVIV